MNALARTARAAGNGPQQWSQLLVHDVWIGDQRCRKLAEQGSGAIESFSLHHKELLRWKVRGQELRAGFRHKHQILHMPVIGFKPFRNIVGIS